MIYSSAFYCFSVNSNSNLIETFYFRRESFLYFVAKKNEKGSEFFTFYLVPMVAYVPVVVVAKDVMSDTVSLIQDSCP